MTKNQSEQAGNSRLKFLPNLPCGEDLFEGKSQDKIAENIINVLQSINTCKIIGIDGQWGSGKSNLVQLVAKKIGKQYHFFIYDAWGHQEDLQRRSILEELIEHLTNAENPIITGDWSKKLKTLLSKSRETETKTIPKISYGIIFSIIALVLTPILKIISDNIESKWWRLPIVGLPAIGMLCLFINYFFEKNNRGGIKERSKKAFTKFFTIYQNKLEEEVKTEVISEDEPSVRKFINYMVEISKDLKQEKLVIVFDNMDRLPQRKVQELWSSIHIFFAENQYDNIKVIVPFDRAHIKNAFKQEDIIGNLDIESKKYGDDFIDKTFNIVYRVSPPILSAWKNYFRIQWGKAFGNDSVQNPIFNSILQIYDSLGKGVTPRNIIAFINEFVSIKQLIADSIPDQYIALFMVGKNKISQNPIDEIIKPSYLKSLGFMFEHDEDLPKYIAALFYQIEPDKAIQVVFTDKLKTALDNNDTERLKVISEIPEFYDILEKVMTDITNPQNAIVCLGTILDDKIGTSQEAQGIWDYLYQKTQPWRESKLSQFQLILLKRMTIHKEEYLDTLLYELRTAEKFNIIDYIDSIDSLSENLPGLGVMNKLGTINIEAEKFITFIQKTRENHPHYKITCEKSDLNSYLSNLEIENASIDYLPYLVQSYQLDEFSKKIEDQINTLAPQRDYKTLSLLFRLYKEVNIENKPLKVELDDATIYTLFNNSNDDDEFHYDLVAMRLAKLEKFHSSYVSVFESQLEQTDDFFVTKISERIEYFISYGDLLKGLLVFKNSPLLLSIVKTLTSKSFGKSRLNILDTIKIFDQICKSGNIDPLKLINKLNDWNKNIGKITPQNVNSYVSIYFIQNALKEKCTISIHCIDSAIKFLNNLDCEIWNSAFKDPNSYEFQLSETLASEYTYTIDAFDAIKNTLKEIAEQRIPIPNKELWESLLSRVKGQGKDLVAAFNGVRDVFIREDDITPEIFAFFGDWLFLYSDMDEQKSSLRTIFKTDVLKDEDNLRLIIENKDKMPSIIEAAKDEAKDFKDCIAEMTKYSSGSDLIDFANYIGIQFPDNLTKKEATSEKQDKE